MSANLSKRGRLFVISGPSGVGKGTLVAQVMKKLPNLKRAVTYTTRQPRQGEISGKDYYFVTREEFERLKQEGAFLEWAEVYGNFYGSPKREVEEILSKGHNVLLVLDVQGALTVKQEIPEALLIFIAPPSLDELRRRIKARGTNPPEDIERRMAKARWEMEQASKFDYILLNDDLEEAIGKLVKLIQSSTNEIGVAQLNSDVDEIRTKC
ncbi:MAG: guanylate kinase [Armatimonadetes bacterium]|nr:guanylate kinase [Armatimonadota bacterium]